MDTQLLDIANDMLDFSIKFRDEQEAAYWLDKVMDCLADLRVKYGENDIDTLYDWVHEFDKDFEPMFKETYEDDLDNYIQGDLKGLWKKYLISNHG
jgi:hypothetical protein